MSTETIVSSPTTRRSFLQAAGATGLAVGAGSLLAGCGGSGNGGSSYSNSVHVSMAAISLGFKSIQADEDNHVQVLSDAITALGGTPRPAPTFNSPALTSAQSSLATFVSLATYLGNTETGIYLCTVPYIVATNTGQALSIAGSNETLSYNPLEAASAIAIVEGRHAGFFNALSGRPLLTDPTTGDTAEPTDDNSRDKIIDPDTTAVRAATFIGSLSEIGTGSGYVTDLNGGPAPLTDATLPGAQLADIFNYALFLEYVGSTFYNLNVPHFFGS